MADIYEEQELETETYVRKTGISDFSTKPTKAKRLKN